MSLELMAYNLDLQARVERLAMRDPTELRKDAIRAARDMDQDALWNLLEAYLVMRGSRGARVSQNTLNAYRIYLRDFLTWAGPAGMSLLRPRGNEPFAYVRHLETQGKSPSTVRGMLSAARGLYSALRWAGATDMAPFTDVRAATDPVPNWQKRKPYSDGDLVKLLAAADPQEKVILHLGADCGLRVTEMTRMLRRDIHLDADVPYLIVTGKRQKRQEVPLSRSAAQAVQKWLTMTPGYATYLLTMRTRRSIEDRMKAICERAGVRYDGKHVHGLRHRAGTKVYQQTKDVLAVRDHLRHASINTTETYVNYARQEEKPVNSDW